MTRTLLFLLVGTLAVPGFSHRGIRDVTEVSEGDETEVTEKPVDAGKVSEGDKDNIEVTAKLVDVEEGQSVTLNCPISVPSFFSSDIQMYWVLQQNGERYTIAMGEEAINSSYSVTQMLNQKAKEGHYDLTIPWVTYALANGMFECRVKQTEQGLDLIVAIIVLTVLIPPGSPEINIYPLSVVESRPVDLICSSEGGSPAPEITWYHEGQELSGTQRVQKWHVTSVLTVTPEKEDNGDLYRCVVWNRALRDGQKLEANVTLDVSYHPRVTVHPTDPVRVELGFPATLKCSVDSNPPAVSLLWKKDGFSIFNDYTLIIKQVRLNDSGSYMCYVVNSNGLFGETTVTLEVLYGPMVTVGAARYVDVGEDVEMVCNITANPAPITVEWVKHGDPSFHQSGNTLRLPMISTINQGDYICRAVNRFTTSSGEVRDRVGNATVAVRLNHSPGTTLISPVSPVVVVGHQITLTCDADPPGRPNPTYHWRRHGSNETFVLGPNFIIPHASPDDEGLYYCKTSNRLGHGTLASVRLKVIQLPRILKRLPESITYPHGKTDLNITCSAEGDPVPSVKWLKNGKGILVEDDMYNILTSVTSGSNRTRVIKSTLHFQGSGRRNNEMVPTDRGIYLCIFKNEAGEVSTSQLIRLEHPPVKAHRFNKVAVDLSDDAYLECRMRAYPQPQLQWSLDQSVIEQDGEKYTVNYTSLADTFSSVLLVRNVTKGDYGQYLCHANNTLGHHNVLITLQERGPPSPPSDLYVESRGINFLKLGWEEGFNGGFQYTTFTVNAEAEYGISVNYDCLTHNPCLIELTPQQTLFRLKVKAMNQAGASNFSVPLEGVTLITEEDIPKPRDVYWNRTTNFLYFKIHPTEELQLKAQAEIRANEGRDWIPTENHISITLDSHYEMKLVEETKEEANVRVRLCSVLVSSSCGSYTVAERVGFLPVEPSRSLPVGYIAALAVVCAMLVLALVVLCCCCQDRKKTTKRKLSRRFLLTQRSYSSQASTVDYLTTPEKEQAVPLCFDDQMTNPPYKPSNTTLTSADITYNPAGEPDVASVTTDISSDATHSLSGVTHNPSDATHNFVTNNSSDITHSPVDVTNNTSDVPNNISDATNITNILSNTTDNSNGTTEG